MKFCSFCTMVHKFLFCLFVLIPAITFPQSWPQWRGPNRDGLIQDFTWPTVWPENLKLVWKNSVGTGIASPVISGTKAWIHTRKEENDVVICIDLETGKTIWVKTYSAPFKGHSAATKMGDGPFATPVLHQGRLYTLGISAILSCFDANTGELKWQKSFGDIDTSTIYCGTSASPIVDGKNLIVQVGDNHRGNIIAFDLVTGNQKWQWNGSSVAYASPIVAELEGVRQVVAHTNDALVGVDANNGQLLWTMPFIESKYRENIVSPVQAGELLIISNGDEGAHAIRPSKKDGKWTPHKVWQNSDIAMYMSTPVIHGDYLFGMSDKRKGMFFCLKTATGEVLWRTKGDEGENASILHSKDVLFF